mmetsp:Transcript_16527/g.29491  ORF Transcript_16527/g.29491 Transcript_16527/m.29491 type:complete len:85 (-) Transcript_16527:65-319(-)
MLAHDFVFVALDRSRTRHWPAMWPHGTLTQRDEDNGARRITAIHVPPSRPSCMHVCARFVLAFTAFIHSFMHPQQFPAKHIARH